MAQAKAQYEDVLGQKEISGLIERGTKKVVKGVATGRKVRNQYIAGRYRTLRKGAEDFIAAKQAQDLKENIQASTQQFVKTEGEKEFLSQQVVVPKGVNTTEQGNVQTSTVLDSGAKLGSGNLVARKTGSRRVTASQRALPTKSGPSLSAAQRRSGATTSATRTGRLALTPSPTPKMSNAEKLRVSNIQAGTPRRVSTRGPVTP